MTQDLDALPLPEPLALLHTGDDFGGERDDPELEFNSFNAAADFCLSKLAKTKVGLHSDDALRAYGQRCYELAKREALEGRAPVGEIFLGTDDKPVPKLYAKHSDLPAGTKLYTSPPPTAEGREPVAWRTFDGEGGYEYRSYEDNEDYADVWMKRNPRHKGWVEPLYTSPPPKSDEAMDALIKAARWFADNPDSPKSALGHITEALAALAATRLAITRAAYEISKEMR